MMNPLSVFFSPEPERNSGAAKNMTGAPSLAIDTSLCATPLTALRLRCSSIVISTAGSSWAGPLPTTWRFRRCGPYAACYSCLRPTRFLPQDFVQESRFTRPRPMPMRRAISS